MDRVTCPQPTQRYEVDGWKHFAIAGDRTFYVGKADGPIAISSDGGRTWHKHATHIPNLTSLAGRVWGFEHEVPLHSGTAHGAIYYPIRKETWKRVDVFARDGVLPTGLFECGEAVCATSRREESLWRVPADLNAPLERIPIPHGLSPLGEVYAQSLFRGKTRVHLTERSENVEPGWFGNVSCDGGRCFASALDQYYRIDAKSMLATPFLTFAALDQALSKCRGTAVHFSHGAELAWNSLLYVPGILTEHESQYSVTLRIAPDSVRVLDGGSEPAVLGQGSLWLVGPGLRRVRPNSHTSELLLDLPATADF
ncbi:MAG: hypothetical protein H6716_01930 [Polyangiaceae bacterium]|nr:hypothetical protein [Polyangiaceae bacterium]